MQRYGLQLRTKPAASSSSRPPPPARPLEAFADDGDDGVEADILRQSSKKRALQKVEEQQKKAMEEDPSVFAYDEVYDDMKQKAARPKMQDKEVRQSKYIAALMEKAEQRKRDQDIIYERKLHKERSKEDHLFADKDKFVTSAYRKKLEEERKWLEEEKRRQLQEEKEDVTKKKDLSDFYFGLEKNVAFGATNDKTKHTKPQKLDNKVEDIQARKVDAKGSDQPRKFNAEGSDLSPKRGRSEKSRESRNVDEPATSLRDTRAVRPTEKHSDGDTPAAGPSEKHSDGDTPAARPSEKHSDGTTAAARSMDIHSDVTLNASQAPQNTQPTQVTDDHYKRSADALAAARERALARKRAKYEV